MNDRLISTQLGLVAIGRNEGARLQACLSSVKGQVAQIVYVDSGSTDGSVAMAKAMGVFVVDLDMGRPFTAARARNEGFQALKRLLPTVEFVQFVDGDCQVADGWLAAGLTFLNQHPQHAVVCGRRREKYPQNSVYNRLCDMEWDTPIGDTKSCGGDAMMRSSAFQAVGGYTYNLIAGEEPELCLRMRRAGWSIFRIDHEMTMHDAGMTRFGQWWNRTLRAGHAFGEGAWLHGARPERHWVRETVRALVWGAFLPIVVLLLALVLNIWWLGAFVVYPLQIMRLSRRLGGLDRAYFMLLGRFPEAIGVLKFHLNRLLGSASSIIEYK